MLSHAAYDRSCPAVLTHQNVQGTFWVVESQEGEGRGGGGGGNTIIDEIEFHAKKGLQGFVCSCFVWFDVVTHISMHRYTRLIPGNNNYFKIYFSHDADIPIPDNIYK